MKQEASGFESFALVYLDKAVAKWPLQIKDAYNSKVIINAGW